jgi:transcriptional regulator with XRE-family HTH domain
MPKTEPANAIDAQIGRNISRRRVRIGLSQSRLAAACGISFQQVQKYEAGTNRVAASRLYVIARTLEVAPADLMPSPGWEAAPDTSAAALERLSGLLAQIKPLVAEALTTAERPHSIARAALNQKGDER